MTDEHIKEDLSKYYLQSIISICGYTNSIDNHDYGMDVRINDNEYNQENKTYELTGFGIDVQLKSTVTYQINDDKIIYDLRVKNYNDLIKTNCGSPRILALYCLPKDKNEWIYSDEKKLILNGSMYWYSLKGLPHSKNKENHRIYIPKNQLFNEKTLKILMNKVKEGEDL